MNEAALQRHIQVDCANPDIRLWRVQIGNFLLADGRRIISGTPGMSDLQGLVSVIITPAMVGQRVAVYAAVEVKLPGAWTEPERLKKQAAFIHTVNKLGGRAGFATSSDEAGAILRGSP